MVYRTGGPGIIQSYYTVKRASPRTGDESDERCRQSTLQSAKIRQPSTISMIYRLAVNVESWESIAAWSAATT